jgi:hypothetical protein
MLGARPQTRCELWGSCALVIALAACERPPNPPPPAPASSASEVDAVPAAAQAPAPGSASASGDEAKAPPASSGISFEKTVGIVSVPREGYPRLQTGLRAAAHDGFDRVVFEFQGGVPGYHLEYVDRPVRDCGEGSPRPIAGDAWLEVRMTPANAHTEEGKPTIPQREIAPGLPNVREIERTCDFEAVVTWVIGVGSPNRYRAFELKDPGRLVVDIDHDR